MPWCRWGVGGLSMPLWEINFAILAADHKRTGSYMVHLSNRSRGKATLIWGLLLVFVVSCIGTFLLGMLVDIGPFGHDRTYVASYPNAQQVRVLTRAQIPTPVPPSDPNYHYWGWAEKEVTFSTSD